MWWYTYTIHIYIYTYHTNTYVSHVYMCTYMLISHPISFIHDSQSECCRYIIASWWQSWARSCKVQESRTQSLRRWDELRHRFNWKCHGSEPQLLFRPWCCGRSLVCFFGKQKQRMKQPWRDHNYSDESRWIRDAPKSFLTLHQSFHAALIGWQKTLGHAMRR